MSTQSETREDDKTKREKHREMALSDLKVAPVLRKTYEKKYGVDPREEGGQS